MIHVLNIDGNSTSTISLPLDIDVITDYMKSKNVNVLFLLKNPYGIQYRAGSLVDLIDGEIYGTAAINRDNTTLPSPSGQSLEEIFLEFIKTCGRILINADRSETTIERIFAQNSQLIVKCQANIEQNKALIKQHDQILHELRDTRKEVNELRQVIKKDDENMTKMQLQMRDLYEMTNTNQKVLLRFLSTPTST
jgi:hypothetical protein